MGDFVVPKPPLRPADEGTDYPGLEPPLPCPVGEIYDPLFDRCVPLFIPVPVPRPLPHPSPKPEPPPPPPPAQAPPSESAPTRPPTVITVPAGGIPRPSVTPLPGGGFTVAQPFKPVPQTGPTLGGNFPITVNVPPPQVSIGGTTFSPSISLAAPSVTVTVNNLETIGAEVASAIASGINTGITTLENDNATIVNNLLGNVTTTLSTLSTTLGTAISDALQSVATHIGDILAGLGRGIADIAKAVAVQIASIFKPIWEDIKTIIDDIKKANKGTLATIEAIATKIIVPVALAVQRNIALIQSLIRAIQTDVKTGITGFLQLPGQIADAVSGLEGTLYRLWQEIRPNIKTDAESNIDYGENHGVGKTLHDLFAGISKSASIGELSTVYQTQDSLAQSCGPELIEQGRNRLISDDGTEAEWVVTIKRIAMDGAITLAQIWGLLANLKQIGEQDIDAKCPVELLTVSQAIEAWQRRFIDESQLQLELKKQGINDARTKVLTDLAHAVNSTSDLIDFWHKGIINDSQFALGYSALGFTAEQTEAAKAASHRLPGKSELLLWLQRGLLTEQDVSNFLRQDRYTEPAAQAILDSRLSYMPVSQRAAIQGLLDASDGGWLRDSLGSPVPQDVVDAATRDGVQQGQARLSWLDHWALPNWREIVQSHFRGLRTINDVHLAMQSQNVPREVWDELMQIARPLIPYRSIPGFVKSGVMSDSEGRAELSRHGYDLQHINWIMKAVSAAKGSGKTATATALHGLSVGAARVLFDDGAIDSQQYQDILVQHNYTPQLAKAQAEVEQMHQHARERKQLIQEQTALVENGEQTVDSAEAVLRQFGITDAELSKFHVSLRRALASKARHPSMAELDKFAKAQLITQDEWRAELKLQGWSDRWLDNFAALIYSSPAAIYPG